MTTDRFRRYGTLLKADGTNQLQRTLPALEPGYIVPDERSLSDLIDYAYKLAAEIRFYDLQGRSTGDWRPFLEPLVNAAPGAPNGISPETYDLRLMSVESADELPEEGHNLVVVALVATDLHIRIFGAGGEKAVDKAENELVPGVTLTALKQRLSPLPVDASLSRREKQQIIGSARSVAGHTSLELALTARRDWPPHVALFLAFLKMFQYLQADLNELPQRHLRHYYEAELGLIRRGAVGDAVHVIFELAKNAAPTLLPSGTLLDAGTDMEGRTLVYATTNDLVVSNATVADIRRTVTEVDRRGNRRFFAADAIATTEANGWHTFGSRQLHLDASQRFMTEAATGFAIASPILKMAEGVRTIDVVAKLQVVSGSVPPAQGIGYALIPALTGAEGWLSPDTFSAELVKTAGTLTLELHMSVSEAAAAVVPFDPSLHGGGPVSEWPVLRCLIRGETGVYETLEGLVVESATIQVGAREVRDLVVQNGDGPLDVNKPMPLFGSQPFIGSPFYIGSAEVFSKKLTYLALNLEWESPPEDLYAHYEAYFSAPDPNLRDVFYANFLVDLDLLYDRSWNQRLLFHQYLFAPTVTDPQSIEALAGAFTVAFGGRSYEAHPELGAVTAYTAGTKYGFVRLTLRGPTRSALSSYATETPFEAFGHQAFAPRYASRAIALSRDEKAPIVLPNEPYTPVLAGLSLDYSATAELVPGDAHDPESLFVVGPFGHAKADAEMPASLVPKFQGEAALHLGVEKLQGPANLSLLFQIDAGTATDSAALRSGDTEWDYLRGNQWEALPATALLNDSTYGFQKPGLVVVAVPREATTQHSIMPNDLIWLRARVQRPPESASRTLALHTQAALAEFVGDEQSDDYAQHLRNGLAAESITRLQRRDAAIKRVMQPYASFDGRSREGDADYFRRCSERLRHRNRAVTPWDCERLVLEEFPEVFKVKCLPHRNAEGDSRAGSTAIVIVPDLRNAETSNPLEPRADAVLMGRIRDFLSTTLATPFSTIHVIHPVYERIRVDVHVAFQSGLDAGFYTALLNEHLRQFLAPWAYRQGEDIVFGARIYKSEILAFLEGRHYIDYVTEFRLYHSYGGPPREGISQMAIGTDFIVQPDPRPAVAEMIVGNDFIVGQSIEVARTTQPHAILVSHPQHLITAISPGQELCSGVARLGIGYMTVGLDFNVQYEHV